jgi:hypothetical protein
MPFGEDLKEVLMQGNALGSTGNGKMSLNLGFDVFSAGSMLDAEQIEHEFGGGAIEGGGEGAGEFAVARPGINKHLSPRQARDC